jgi:hypothetical protein
MMPFGFCDRGDGVDEGDGLDEVPEAVGLVEFLLVLDRPALKLGEERGDLRAGERGCPPGRARTAGRPGNSAPS